MPRENARKTEEAWKRRDEEAARNQAQAAGQPSPADVRFGGTPQMRTMKVHIVGADSSFVEDLKRALGLSSNGAGTSFSSGTSEFGELHTQLQSIITDQQAISQATKQVAQDLSLAVNMVMNYQATVARQMGAYVSDMSNLRQQETMHMQNLVSMMTSAVVKMQGVVPNTGSSTSPPSAPSAPVPNVPPVLPPPPPPPGGPGGGPGGPPGGGGGRRTPRPGGGGGTTMSMLRQQATRGYRNWTAGHGTAGNTIASTVGTVARRAARSNPITGLPLAAFEVANDAATWITNQRQANAQYQAIYDNGNFSLGGALSQLGSFITGNPSNDTSGFGQRMAEEGFVLSQRFSGGMTGDQAREVFQGVSQLGFAGDQRSNALQFVSDNYKQMGMDIAQSLQLVQSAAQSGNQSLAGLAQQLQAVSSQAAATGQNASVLRQQFAGYYAQGLQSGLGAGAGSIAAVLTQTTSGTNRDLANVNYNSLLSNPVLMQTLAAQQGMTLGQMESQVAQGNTGAFTQALGQRTNQVLTGAMDQNIRTLFAQQVQQAGGYQRVAQTPGSQYNIAVQLMQSRDWNVMEARAALGTLGIDTSKMNDEQIAEYYVSTLASGGVQAAGKTQQKQLGTLTPQQRASAASGSTMGGSPFLNQMFQQRMQGGGPGLLDWASQLFGGDSTENNYKNAKSIAQAYQGYEAQSGNSNPAIESMISTLGTTGTAQLRVKTPQGDRVVSMQDAIKYYSDQISTGSAVVVGGTQNGKTLGEATGTLIAGYQSPRPGGSAKNGPGNIGQSWADYQKANPSQQQGPAGSTGTQTNGTVTVSPSPMLMQMFNWSSSGGVNIMGSTAQGVTPMIPGGNF